MSCWTSSGLSHLSFSQPLVAIPLPPSLPPLSPSPPFPQRRGLYNPRPEADPESRFGDQIWPQSSDKHAQRQCSAHPYRMMRYFPHRNVAHPQSNLWSCSGCWRASESRPSLADTKVSFLIFVVLLSVFTVQYVHSILLLNIMSINPPTICQKCSLHVWFLWENMSGKTCCQNIKWKYVFCRYTAMCHAQNWA